MNPNPFRIVAETEPTLPMSSPRVQALIKRYRETLSRITSADTRKGAEIWMRLAKEYADAIEWMTGEENWDLWK